MPRGQPFTLLCQQLARLGRPTLADLHAHTTASDGDFTPSQLVATARNAGVAAVAVTDHDTTAGVPEAIATAAAFAGRPVEVVAGVEVSAASGGRELHLLGLFVDVNDAAVQVALAGQCRKRRERFRGFARELAARGAPLRDEDVALAERTVVSLGRRHLANLLVRAGHAASRHDAFRRWLEPAREAAGVDHRLPFAEAVRVIRSAGGVCGLAHPPADFGFEDLQRLADAGLQSVEATFPAAGAVRSQELRGWAGRLGLAVTGGSDSHGPAAGRRRVGSHGVGGDELETLRNLAGRPSGAASVSPPFSSGPAANSSPAA